MRGGSKFTFILIRWMVERKRNKNKKVLIWMVYSPGQDIVRSVAGPMACNLATIERYMEVLPEARPWEVDQHVAPVAWRKELASPGAKRLRIGFLVDDGVVKVQPPIARAMREVTDSLKAAGHDGMIPDSNFSQRLLRTVY
jgi:Asp-tRNA(Asn)/Glu-tRNA(Gln) amidotransferase A subunit family amidase